MKAFVIVMFTIGMIFFIGLCFKVIGMAAYVNDGTYPGSIALTPWPVFSPSALVFLAWTKHLKDF